VGLETIINRPYYIVEYTLKLEMTSLYRN